MNKKGVSLLIFIVALFILTTLVILVTWFFFFSEDDSKEADPLTSFSIVLGSVVLDTLENNLYFNLSLDADADYSGFSISLEDEFGNLHSVDFSDKRNDFSLDYSQSNLGKIKEFSIKPLFSNSTLDSLSYQISESDILRNSCNNDGIKSHNELCDDGTDNNDDCLDICVPASCGDSFVWNEGSGDEDCDGSDFGIYGDGVEMCAQYDEKYYSGDLGCNSYCQVETSSCQKKITAVRLNGVNSSIDIGSLTLEEEKEYSFSFWVKPLEVSGGSSPILGCTNSRVSLDLVNKEYIFSVFTDRDNIEKIVRAGGASFGEWDHVAIVHSHSSGKIYLNGNLMEAKSQSGEIKDDVTCVLGAKELDNSKYFNGMIDEVRVYDKVLAKNEVVNLYEMGQNWEFNSTGVLVWWNFEEGEGISIRDVSGNGYAASLIDGFEWIEEVPNN